MIELILDHDKAIAEMFRWTRGNEQAHWVGYGNGTYKVTMPVEDMIIFKLKFAV